MRQITMILSILLAMVFVQACSDTQGGAKRDGQRTGADAKPGLDGDTDVRTDGSGDSGGGDAGDGGGDGDGDEDVTDDDGNGDDGGEDDAGEDGGNDDARFAEVCDLIKEQSFYKDIKDEYEYMCEDGGFEKVVKKLGNVQTIEDEQKNGFSHISFAAAGKTKGRIEAAEKMSEVFCEDFEEYKNIVGEDTFKDVESLTPKNGSKGNCDFRFVGIRILFFQPSYKGKVKTVREGDILINAQYLTEKESLVEDSKSITISIQDGDNLEYYMIQTSVSDTKGFHSITRNKIKEGMQKGVNGFPKALGNAEDLL